MRSSTLQFTTARLVSLTILWLAGQGQSFGQTKMSLSDALSLAQKNSPTPREALAKVRSASAKLQGAGALPNPTLSLAHGIGKDTGGLDEDILITQTVDLPNKRGNRVRAARAERDAALADQATAMVDLAFAVRSAYFEALRADVELRLAQESLTHARAFGAAADIQFKAGDVARSNVLRSQVEQIRAEQALAAAETDQANRYAALRSLVGLTADFPIALADSLGYAPKPLQIQDLRSRTLNNRPDLQSARRLLEARSASVRVARDQMLPDLFVEARHSDIDPTVGGNSLRFGVILPLLDYGRNRSETRAAKAALEEQRAVLDEAVRTALLEVETAYRNREQAAKAVESFQSGRLDRSKELMEMAQIGYQKGASSYLELLDAQQVYRSEQADYARALAAFNIATATLQKAVGGTLP